jgi:uncharacterized membrane protein YkoI
MDRNKLVATVLAGTVAAGTLGLTGALAGAAYAKNGRESATDDAAIVANAKVTMTQAIAVAESQVGGKAVGSGIEDQNGTVAFEVEVLKDGQRHKVLIDPQSGQVVKSAVADNEHDGNGDERDDD